MRRQKRDQTDRAYGRGYQAGFDGKSRTQCPHDQEGAIRQTWLNGWREGREDHWNGVNRLASVQKMISM